MTKSIDNSIIEQIKSGLLVVLTISTILLLYFFWGDMSLEDFSLIDTEEEYAVMNAKEIVRPDQIIVSMGEDSYKLAPSNSWNVMAEGLKKFAESETLVLEEITKEQYEQVMELSSLRASFHYPLSFNELCEAYGIKKSAAFDNVATVSELGYGSVSKESLLIFDETRDKCYRIIVTEEIPLLGQLLNELSLGEGAVYFTIDSYLGGEVKNNTLIPISIETNLKNFAYTKENYTLQPEKTAETAQDFFGKTFDFIRKIEEGNGTIIYMYGYGQKVLIVNKDGVIEYKEESTKASGDVGYAESLQTALNFIAGHGGFESLNGSEFEPYLKDVEYNVGDKKGYRFTFGIKINNTKIHYQENQPIIVEVIHNQVTYFKRDLAEYEGSLEDMSSNSNREAYSAINMLAQNYEFFIQEMKMTGSFEEIAANIWSVEPGFVFVPEESEPRGEARAAWIVGFENMEAYFDLYTAEPIGFRTK